MSNPRMPSRRSRGFTLVELLIVIATFSVVMAAVYSLYQTQQRSAYSQDEVADVQQNLRIAMDTIARDVRMAGSLIPSANTPISNVGNLVVNGVTTDTLTINTASAEGAYAWVDQDTTTPSAPAAAAVVFRMYSSEGSNTFTAGETVRILRRQVNNTSNQVFANQTFQVTAINSGALTPTPPNMQLVRTDGQAFTANVQVTRGDVVARTAYQGTEAFPNTIVYAVVAGSGASDSECPTGQVCLARNVNGTGNEIVAQNIRDLQFRFLLTNNTEVDTPTAAQLSEVRAVRVIIEGQTISTATLSGGAKTRRVESVVKIRNRRTNG